MKHTQQEIEDAKDQLRTMIKSGDTVYTILRHVSSSGMSRVIDLKVIKAEYTGDLHGMSAKPVIANIGHLAAIATEYAYDTRHEGIKIGGCGMDMGFHIVYQLGSVLFGRGEETQKLGYHTGRNGTKEAENNGGYLLKQSWL